MLFLSDWLTDLLTKYICNPTTIKTTLSWISLFYATITITCEDFESYNGASYYTGTAVLTAGTWDFTSVFKETATHGGTVACRNNDDVAGANITSPSFSTVGTVSFWCRPLNPETSTFQLQKSVNGGAFTTIDSYDYGASTSFVEYTYAINEISSDVKIRILNDRYYSILEFV